MLPEECGPNLENDTETRNAQEERIMTGAKLKGGGKVMRDSEDSEEFRRFPGDRGRLKD